MHRPLHGSIALTLAVAVGGFGAYALLVPDRAVAAPVSTSCAEPAVVSYRHAVARAAPSVVTVHAAHVSSAPLAFGPRVKVQGVASGVIFGSDGYVVTNHHAVREATELV
jgi:S1-C subfamily serine protease